MEALLIVAGVILTVLGWLWLWLRIAQIHWLLALASAVPPLALLSGLYNWRQTVLPLLTLGAGFAVLGGGLWQLGQAQPEQLERLLRGQWSDELLLSGDADRLQGQLQGQAFVAEQALFRRGVLTLRQGRDFIASKEIRLDLSSHGPALLGERFALDILPTDSGSLPMVEVLWQDVQAAQPQARRIARGYTLRLQLLRLDGDLQGQLYLSLPSRLATTVSGNFHVAAADEQPDPLWLQAIEGSAGNLEPEQADVQQAEGDSDFSLVLLLVDPQTYLQRTFHVETAAGRQVRGKFQGINEEGELLLRQRVKGSGFVVFQIVPDEIVQIRLEN